ncbi:MAG: hypothetical protein HKN81_07150 [Gammaproteobacteria bacterium]|nr:peptidoglycan binding protein CsiV [Gammaproteobacteria bacterium]NND36898.1 hypothetical protein [Gammaproteobacteria bacterium]
MRRHSDYRGRRLASLATLILLAGPAPAAETEPEPWMTDRYEVEIIVFRHLDQARNTPEQPAVAQIVAASLPGLYAEVPEAPYVVAPNSAARVDDDRPRPPDVSFYLLDTNPDYPDYVPLDDGKRMTRVHARLDQLDAYAPMLHRAWILAARPADEAVAVYVRSDEIGDFSVTGTIKLFKERYVHLRLDLQMASVAEQTITPETETWPTFGDVYPTREPAQAPLQADTPAYNLTESRRIRGENAQYFDHPQFGVLARISAIELEEEEPETE